MRQFLTIILVLTLVAAVGTIGIHTLTDKSWLESAYLAVVTLATVGSRDMGTTPATMLFTIVYIIVGLSIFSYAAFQLGQLIINTDLRRLWERRSMINEIGRLKQHFIVCGLGRMGLSIAEYLARKGKLFVIVERDVRVLEELSRQKDWLYVEGDATDDNVLTRAGIDRAKGLATVLPTDADNVYVVLSARMLSPKIQIVARAGDDSAVQKLQRAGATRVISPFSSGAVKMARFMLNPSVEDFLEITDTGGGDLELADIVITEQNPYVGKKLAETDLRQQGVMVLGIRRSNGERLLPPPGTAVIEAGDSLLAFGSATAVQRIISGSTVT